MKHTTFDNELIRKGHMNYLKEHMTVQHKIDVYEKTRSLLKDWAARPYSICSLLRQSTVQLYNSMTNKNIMYYELRFEEVTSELFPELLEHKPSDHGIATYWWAYNDKGIRLEVLDDIINKLKDHKP